MSYDISNDILSNMEEKHEKGKFDSLPKEWKYCTLENAVKSIDYGHSISIPKNENSNGIYILSTADITKDGKILYNQIRKINPPKKLLERLVLEDGDILFNWRNSPELIGKTAIFKKNKDEDYIYASFILRIRCNETISNNLYLKYLLNYYREKGVFLKLSRRAVNQANYNRNEINKLEIPLPPISEQKKIVVIISAIQDAKEKIEAVIEATKILKNSLMDYLFTYGPVPVGKAENVNLKETEIGFIPKDWEIVSINNLTKKSFGGGTPSTKNPKFWNGDIPWTTTAIINPEDMYLKKYQRKITELGLTNSSTKLVPPNSILVGTRVGVGKIVLTTFEIAINQDVTAIIPKDEILPEFLVLSLKTPKIQKDIDNRKRGTTIKGIPKKDLIELKIALPPLSEQKKIIDIIMLIDQKIRADEKKKNALEELFKTMLNDLMTAKIRINDFDV